MDKSSKRILEIVNILSESVGVQKYDRQVDRKYKALTSKLKDKDKIEYYKRQQKEVESALREFDSKRRTMGCVSATEWFIKRVTGFKDKRKTIKIPRGKYRGEYYQHVVATNGKFEIDVAPYSNTWKED